MFGSELRTYDLSAVVSVLLGTGIGLGWYYFVDSAGGRAVAAAHKRPYTTPAKMCAKDHHAENTSRVDSWHAELAAPQSPPLTRPGRTLGDARKDLAGATFQLGATPDPEASIAEMRRFKEEVLSRLWPHRALCVGTGRAKLSRRPVARFCPIGSIPRLTPWQWSWHRAMLERAAPAVP